MGSEAIGPIVERVRELAALQTTLAEKRAKSNAAIPGLDASTAERQAYKLLYQAGNDAERAVQGAALKLAVDAPGLIEALAYHDPNCPYPCCD